MYSLTVKGGGGGATGINLSFFSGGFHTVDGVTVGPGRKFTSFSFVDENMICAYYAE